jgi:hypothetical protein
MLILCAAITALFFLLYFNREKTIISMQIIILAALFGYGIINIKEINERFIFIKSQRESRNKTVEYFSSHYTLSKTGKNVMLIMLDCTMGGYVPYIFEEKPELYSSMKGFHWYPNTSSFANHTLIAAPPIYGGYEYSPAAINARDNIPLLIKQQEAYLLLPKIFSDAGYSVTVTDPPFDNYQMSNLAIFSDFPEIKAENLNGKHTARWLSEHKDIAVFDIAQLLEDNLIRFSFFKSSPLFLRLFIYDKGKWLKPAVNIQGRLSETTINDYVFLDSLNKITAFTENGDTYTAIYAHLPHDAAFLQAPDYIPAQTVTDRGSGKFAGEAGYHVTMASFLLLGKWFQFLDANGVYDNTRIIIVADHGRVSAAFPDNKILPNGDSLQSYNVLLMEKDFYADGTLTQSNTFMTNADTPLLALEGLIDNPLNPFTQNPLQPDKKNGIEIVTIGALSTYRHTKFTYNIGKNQWLFVKDNIFDMANWKVVPK